MKFSKTFAVLLLTSFIAISLAVHLLLTTFSSVSATPNNHHSHLVHQCNQVYNIYPGDTSFTIAMRHGLTWDEYQSLNPNPHKGTHEIIYPGHQVCVGIHGGIPSIKHNDRTYKTELVTDENQSCGDLADRFFISHINFKLLNPSLNCREPVAVNTWVVVSRGLHPHCTKNHLIVPGDNSWKIANDNGLDLQSLQTLNPGLSLDLIYPDNILCVKAE